MAKSTYRFIGSELEKWMLEFLSNNGNLEGDNVRIKAFMKEWKEYYMLGDILV